MTDDPVLAVARPVDWTHDGVWEDTMLSTHPVPTRPADATEEGRPPVRRPVLNRRLTVLAAAAATVAAAPSFFAPGLLHGVPVMDGNLRGTALVTLMTVPLLLLASWRGRVDPRATAVWVGALAYLLYQGVMFSFATPMNSLFLAYVALLAAAGWALAVLVLHVDHPVAARRLGPAFPARPLAVVLAVTAGLNALAWLVLSAPVTWTGRVPSVVVDSGLPTAVTWVQDLSFWLPAAMVVAFLTWRGRPTGPLLAAFFVYYTLEALGVASDQWWGTRADDQHPELASYPAAAGALVVAVLMGGITCWALWRRTPRASTRTRGPSQGLRRALVATSGLTSLAALVGSGQLVTGTYAPPVSDLEPLGLDTWVLPGIWLLLSVALPCGITAVLAWRASPSAGAWGIAAGVLLLVELAVQIPFVGWDPLQPTLAVVAVLLVLLGFRVHGQGRRNSLGPAGSS
jgi:hypothetical protein